MSILSKPENIRIDFILGATRSGTTLLSNILNNHKNCVSSSEIKHLLLFHKKYHAMKEVTAALLKDVEYYKAIMEQASEHSYANSTFKIELGEKLSYFEFCKRVYFTSAPPNKSLHEVTRIVDKNPFYTLQADKLISILPDTRFICAVRDYRSFVLSNMQSVEPFAKKVSVKNYSIIWMFYNKLVLEIQDKYPENTLIVPYEKLAANKEQTFQEIFRFLDIAYDADCFNYQENLIYKKEKEKYNDERYSYKKDSLLKPVNTDRLNAWEGFFTNFQLKTMDFWCSKTGNKLGYKKTTNATFIESIAILAISVPYYIRAFVYFKLKSIKLNFYLNEGRRARYFQSIHKQG